MLDRLWGLTVFAAQRKHQLALLQVEQQLAFEHRFFNVAHGFEDGLAGLYEIANVHV